MREACQFKIGQRILNSILRVHLNPNFRESGLHTIYIHIGVEQKRDSWEMTYPPSPSMFYLDWIKEIPVLGIAALQNKNRLYWNMPYKVYTIFTIHVAPTLASRGHSQKEIRGRWTPPPCFNWTDNRKEYFQESS